MAMLKNQKVNVSASPGINGHVPASAPNTPKTISWIFWQTGEYIPQEELVAKKKVHT